MPAQWITKSNATEVRLSSSGGGDRADILYDLLLDPLLQDPQGNKTKIAIVLKDLINADLQVRIKVKDLPDDDPEKDTNPEKGERAYWEGQGNNKELVHQSTICDSVVWDGTRYLCHCRVAV